MLYCQLPTFPTFEFAVRDIYRGSLSPQIISFNPSFAEHGKQCRSRSVGF